MLETISAPDWADHPSGNTTPDGRNWLDGSRAQIDTLIHQQWLAYAVAGALALLLALSLRARSKRANQTARNAGNLTRTDRAVTRITGILATAVVATGAWKVFGDVLHLHPAIRLVLFFFAEAQIIAAWRRIRRHIHRHAELGSGTRTIYGIALGSATVAAFDAASPVEVLLRFFAAFVAAYMIVEELAEELDIHLTANPHLRTGERQEPKRGMFGFKWALTPERVMVWLRLAEPTERTVEEIERQRRIARFARTAHRLHTLRENEAAKWRIRWARWSLRRQTESGNEHLNLAGDPLALEAVRAQLALLYTAESATSRTAVADLSPLRPAPRLAIAASAHPATQPASQEPPTETISGGALSAPTGSQPHTQPAAPGETSPAFSPEIAIPDTAARANGKAAANGGKPTVRPSHPLADHPNESVRKLARAYSRKPHGTNADLAKLAKVSPGTANRYMAEVRAAFGARESGDDTQERAQVALTQLPVREPSQPVAAGVNGSHFKPEEN